MRSLLTNVRYCSRLFLDACREFNEKRMRRITLPHRSPSLSLRKSLQAFSLLAVLAGYAVLLVITQQLAMRYRLERHRRMLDEVGQELRLLPANSPIDTLQQRLDGMVVPGWLLWLEQEPGQPHRIPKGSNPEFSVALINKLVPAPNSEPEEMGKLETFYSHPHYFIKGSLPINTIEGQARVLVVDDVSDEINQARTVQLLVLVVAGASSLLTSGLLRLVLRQGLQPVDQLSRKLEGLDDIRLGKERLPIKNQPVELQPIVRSFNTLLDRLSAGRNREREFVDGVAHELRTPITLISGFAQRLQRQGHHNANIIGIEREAKRMTRLVADLLDIARDEAGRLEMRSGLFDLDDALLLAFERMEPLAGQRLVLKTPGDGPPPMAWGDAERLQQCLTNLVENALKHTPADAAIELYSSCSGSAVVAHVRDHGPGVPQADKRRIFDRFVRGSHGAIDKDGGGGSGIGLAVVKLLMERMGGSVTVVDAPGGGADFQLQLRYPWQE